MSNNTLNTRILLCGDTTANWEESTKVLLKSEVGIEFPESGEPKVKIGNGTDVWADLPYITLTPTEINTLITTLNASAHTHSNGSILDATTASFTTALKSKLDGITASADSVSFTRSLTGGTKVGTITINGAGTDLYAPTNTDTKYDLGASASAANGNVKINLTGSDSTTDSVTVKGAGSVSVTSDADGNITVTGTDTKYTHPNSGVTAGTYKSVTVNAQGHVTGGTNPTTLAGYGITDAVKSSEKGSANGVATLGADGKVPSTQLPSYVDDVIEGYLSGGKFYKESAHTTEITGESGKIYVDLTTNKTYRWSGSAFVVVSETIALGETSSSAYRGDRGKIAYDHSQTAHAPANAEANQNAFSNITVGSTTIEADAKMDTLTLVAGNNVTITPDATNDKITISATNTDTKYSPGTGLALSGTTFNHSNSVEAGTAQGDANKTLAFGGTFAVPSVTYDAQGHITGKGTTTMTMPAAPTSVSGNAGSATKLATARAIDGVTFNGTAAISHYAECSTAAATAAKTVDLTNFTLATGSRIMVKFTVTNTAASPTLNVNSTGAKAIMYRGAAISAGYLAAKRVYELVYDGTNWELVGDINTDTNTKVTNTLATTTKAYITGTTSATTSTGTQVFDTGVYLDTTAGKLVATTFSGALSGNASSATKLATARTIALSGAATGTATSFNGSANITIPVTSLNAINLTLSAGDTLILNGGGA